MLTALFVLKTATDSLVGLWVCDTTFGPKIRGELAVQRVGTVWNASMRGRSLSITVQRDSIRISVPQDGEFRGRLDEKARQIRGFWIQPPGVTLRDSFTTPLTLRSNFKDVWVGTIVPLEDRATLYLSILRRPDSSLSGVFRSSSDTSRFDVSQAGDSVRLGEGASGRLDQRTLALRGPQLCKTLRLKPVDTTTYKYREPADLKDGWRTARAKNAGFDEAALAALVRQIRDSNPLPQALLIAWRGHLVLEEYFHGFTPDRPLLAGNLSAKELEAVGRYHLNLRDGSVYLTPRDLLKVGGVVVAPELDLVVVFTGGDPRVILPAIRR